MKWNRRAFLGLGLVAHVAGQYLSLSLLAAAALQSLAYACGGVMAITAWLYAVAESNLHLAGQLEGAEALRHTKNAWFVALMYGVVFVSIDSAIVPACSGDIRDAVAVALAPPFIVLALFALLLSVQYPSTDDE